MALVNKNSINFATNTAAVLLSGVSLATVTTVIMISPAAQAQTVIGENGVDIRVKVAPAVKLSTPAQVTFNLNASNFDLGTPDANGFINNELAAVNGPDGAETITVPPTSLTPAPSGLNLVIQNLYTVQANRSDLQVTVTTASTTIDHKDGSAKGIIEITGSQVVNPVNPAPDAKGQVKYTGDFEMTVDLTQTSAGEYVADNFILVEVASNP